MKKKPPQPVDKNHDLFDIKLTQETLNYTFPDGSTNPVDFFKTMKNDFESGLSILYEIITGRQLNTRGMDNWSKVQDLLWA